MKKIFYLQQNNKHPDRLLESVKYEVRRYLKRERKKKLPDEDFFWDFDCKFGVKADTAKPLKAAQIITQLDEAKAAQWQQCYIEILAVAKLKPNKSENPTISEGVEP